MTNKQPSQSLETIAASLTARIGGQSTMIYSYCFLSSSKSLAILSLPRRAVGYGALVPLFKQSIPFSPCLMASFKVIWPARTSVTPFLFSTLKERCNFGLRKSRSTTITFFSSSAYVAAMLRTVTDLPSPCIEEQTWRTWIRLSTFANSKAVLILL